MVWQSFAVAAPKMFVMLLCCYQQQGYAVMLTPAARLCCFVVSSSRAMLSSCYQQQLRCGNRKRTGNRKRLEPASDQDTFLPIQCLFCKHHFGYVPLVNEFSSFSCGLATVGVERGSTVKAASPRLCISALQMF